MKDQPHDLVPWEDLKDISLHQGNSEKFNDRGLLQDMIDNKSGCHGIGFCYQKNFGNGRKQMTALICQRQGGLTLFCEQQTWRELTKSVCPRVI